VSKKAIYIKMKLKVRIFKV